MNRQAVAQELVKVAKSLAAVDEPFAETQLKHIIGELAYLPVWPAFSDERMGKTMEVKKKQAVALLEEIIYAIPTPVTFTVAGVDGIKEFDDEQEMVRWLKSKGIKMTGTEVSVRLRPELYGKPRFDKLIGPMYDGPKGVRYETQESYDESSR